MDRIAKAEIEINAPIAEVWDALTNPDRIQKYMFGTRVTSTWQKGSSISWKGEWKGKTYEDKGKILEIEPPVRLKYTHFSPLSGLEDLPENYHTVSVSLSEKGPDTHVILEQDKNPTKEAQSHSEENWKMMLTQLKKLVEDLQG